MVHIKGEFLCCDRHEDKQRVSHEMNQETVKILDVSIKLISIIIKNPIIK